MGNQGVRLCFFLVTAAGTPAEGNRSQEAEDPVLEEVTGHYPSSGSSIECESFLRHRTSRSPSTGLASDARIRRVVEDDHVATSLPE